MCAYISAVSYYYLFFYQHRLRKAFSLCDFRLESRAQSEREMIMKRVVLYISDKCPHCKDAQRYLDSKKIAYRLTNAKMQRGRKELQAMGARSVPVLKIGDQVMVGWDVKTFDRMYTS